MNAVATIDRPRSRKNAPHKKQVSGPVTPRRIDLPGTIEGLDLSTLGGRLTFARNRVGVTQHQLAAAINKSRPTVIMYESDKISPPVQVVAHMARVLRVSPGYLAYGEHGVPTASLSPDEIITIEEVTYGRDGTYSKGAFALPRVLAESYTSHPERIKAFVLNHNAPAFDLRSGDRIFADTSIRELTADYDLYLIELPTGGFEIVRYEQSFEKSATVNFIGPKGIKVPTKIRGLTIIGAVVSTLRHQ